MLKCLLSLPAVKNQATGDFILDAKGKEAKSHVFIEMGLEWEYTVDHGKESLKTIGPLHEAISVLVSLAYTFSAGVGMTITQWYREGRWSVMGSRR